MDLAPPARVDGQEPETTEFNANNVTRDQPTENRRAPYESVAVVTPSDERFLHADNSTVADNYAAIDRAAILNNPNIVYIERDFPAPARLVPSEPMDSCQSLYSQQPPRTLCGDMLSDHANYYSLKNLGLLAAGVGVAAIMANTNMDSSIRNNYQSDLRNNRTDDFSDAFHASKFLGDGYITIPVFAGAALIGSHYDDTCLGRASNEWGQRSLRTVLVGGPPVLALQVFIGASRPGETGHGSKWTPFQDNNGISGHSFMGAIPFISAAKMTDNLFWKTTFYAGSTLAGLSRINDDKHYTSQVVLGWWMAYIAATAVDETQLGKHNVSIFPWAMGDGTGIGVEYRR